MKARSVEGPVIIKHATIAAAQNIILPLISFSPILAVRIMKTHNPSGYLAEIQARVLSLPWLYRKHNIISVRGCSKSTVGYLDAL
jgi:hypothetical protein